MYKKLLGLHNRTLTDQNRLPNVDTTPRIAMGVQKWKITLVGVGVGVGVGVVQFMVLFLEKRKKPTPHYAYWYINFILYLIYVVWNAAFH